MASKGRKQRRLVHSSSDSGVHTRSIPELDLQALQIHDGEHELTNPVIEPSPSFSSIRGKLSRTLNMGGLFTRSKSMNALMPSSDDEDITNEFNSRRRNFTRSKSFYRVSPTEPPKIKGFKHASGSQIHSSMSKPPPPFAKKEHGISRLLSFHPKIMGKRKKQVTFVKKPTIIPPSPHHIEWDDYDGIFRPSVDGLNAKMEDYPSPSSEDIHGIDYLSRNSSDIFPVDMEMDADVI